MTRPRRNLLLLLLFVVAALVLAPRLPDLALWLAAAAGGLVIVVSVLAGRHLFKGRSLMGQQRWDDAALELAAFEQEQSRGGWRAALAFLFVGTYSSNGLAVARATLGAVRLEQGKLDEAEAHLRRALEADPGYAVPHANLALVAARKRDATAAQTHRARAHALGFRRKAFDAALAEALATKS
ncbi:MAG: hypothetical protein AMXMBFR34_37580 [Myxococcaceae bacterium]